MFDGYFEEINFRTPSLVSLCSEMQICPKQVIVSYFKFEM